MMAYIERAFDFSLSIKKKTHLSDIEDRDGYKLPDSSWEELRRIGELRRSRNDR
jgi:hypothetical protein